jgi:hypothetical protein
MNKKKSLGQKVYEIASRKAKQNGQSKRQYVLERGVDEAAFSRLQNGNRECRLSTAIALEAVKLVE